MIYEYLKIIHILSACLLFGTGLGTATYMFMAHRSQNNDIIALTFKHVVKGDWYFTLPSGVIQSLTGLAMVFVHNIAFSEFWIWGSLCGYIIAGVCWAPVVYLQIRLAKIAAISVKNCQPLPREYYRKFYQWCVLGIPAFLSLVIVFYLMVNRPKTF